MNINQEPSIKLVGGGKHMDRFRCPYCGRFVHFIKRYLSYYNDRITDLNYEWKCSKCGHVKEGYGEDRA